MNALADWGRADELDDINGAVALVGVGETQYSGPSGRAAADMAGEAVAKAIEDAGLRPQDIDGLTLDPYITGYGEEDFRRQFGVDHDIWISNEGGGMTWAATCFYTAALALRQGLARHIVNVFAVDWASNRHKMTGGPGEWHASEPLKAQLELPFGFFPQPVYLATMARRHMAQYGTTVEQIAEIALSARRHANGHQGAVMREKKLSLEDYLASPMLADPFRKEDCCLISDGGAAWVMTTPERARDLKHRPITALGVAHGVIDRAPYITQQRDYTSTPQVFSAPSAFAMAGITPVNVDVLTVYDCFSIEALMQIEDMGFCDKGAGGAFISGGKLDWDHARRGAGGVAFNTHGGLLSHAYVLGIAHVVELARQLRCQADNQVDGARIGVYGGYTGATASTVVLAAD